MTSSILTHELLKLIIHYSPDTGVFTRISSRYKPSIGVISSTANSNGYFVIGILGKLYPAHRIAWCLVHGYWPSKMLDHINHDKIDNRLVNLREATSAQNQKNTGAKKNNTSGYKGVSYNKKLGKWGACVRANGKHTHLGVYATPEEASIAYEASAKIHYGEFYYKND